jgi:hypothetical protein
MDKGQATSQQEVNHGFAQPKKTFGSRLKRSCARFWWLYVLAFVVIVLVIVLPMYDCSFFKTSYHYKLTRAFFQNLRRVSEPRAEDCQRSGTHD